MIAFFSPSRAKNQLKISFLFAKNEPAGDRIDPDLAICPCLTYSKLTRHFSNKKEGSLFDFNWFSIKFKLG